MRRGLVLTLATAAALVSASAATGAGGPACGDPITADLVLEADLIGCSTGLVVAADDITIDLNGHLIEGQSSVAGAGVGPWRGLASRSRTAGSAASPPAFCSRTPPARQSRISSSATQQSGST